MKILTLIGIGLWLLGETPNSSCAFAQAEASSGNREAETFEPPADRSSGNSSRKSSSESTLGVTNTGAITLTRLLSNIFLRGAYNSASNGKNDEKKTFLRVTESSTPTPSATTTPTINESTISSFPHTHVTSLSGTSSTTPSILDEIPTESPPETTKLYGLSTKPSLFPTKMSSPLPTKSPSMMPSVASTGDPTKQMTLIPTISTARPSTISTTELSSTISMTSIDRPRRQQTIEPTNELVSETDPINNTIELISAFPDDPEIEKVEKGMVNATTRILRKHRENTAKSYKIASVVFPEDCSIGFQNITDDGVVCYRVMIFVLGGETKQAISFLKEKVENGDFEEMLNSNGFDSSVVSEKLGELRMSELQWNFILDEAEAGGRNDILLAVDEFDIGLITELIEDAAVEILKEEHVCFEEGNCGIIADVIPRKCWNQMFDFNGTKVGNICYRLELIFVVRKENDQHSDFMSSIEKSITDTSLEDALKGKLDVKLIVVSDSKSPTMDPSVSPTESPSSAFFPTHEPSFESIEPTPLTTSSERPVNVPDENENDLVSSKSGNLRLFCGAMYLIILFCIAIYLITLIVFVARSGGSCMR